MARPRIDESDVISARLDREMESAGDNGLIVSLTKALSDEIRAHAADRMASPKVMAAALLRRVVERGLVDELMGEDRPESVAGGFGRRPVGGQVLTELQRGLLYLIGLHAGDDGICRIKQEALAAMLGKRRNSNINRIYGVLQHRGLIAPAKAEGPIQPWRITRAGRRVFDELAGLDGEGGRV